MNIKKLLKQYNSIVNEIKDLNTRITKLENKKIGVERDSVKGSNPYFPYQPRSFTIEGYDYLGADARESKLLELRSILYERKSKCEEMKVGIEEFISTIPDSRTRRVFQYRYIDNLNWLLISRKFGKYDESYSRKIHERYLEGLEEEKEDDGQVS